MNRTSVASFLPICHLAIELVGRNLKTRVHLVDCHSEVFFYFGQVLHNATQNQRQTLTLRHKPQLQRRFCVTDTAGVQPIERGLSPRPRTLTCNQTVVRSPGWPFSGLHPRNPCKYMVYY